MEMKKVSVANMLNLLIAEHSNKQIFVILLNVAWVWEIKCDYPHPSLTFFPICVNCYNRAFLAVLILLSGYSASTMSCDFLNQIFI